VKKEKEAASPKDEFDRLLKEQVKSTRTSWTEFRRDWKKERRFWGWGRDDKEREKRFKEYIKELREREHLPRRSVPILNPSQKNTKLPKRPKWIFSLC
jgi:transcription elongation regulator 1